MPTKQKHNNENDILIQNRYLKSSPFLAQMGKRKKGRKKKKKKAVLKHQNCGQRIRRNTIFPKLQCFPFIWLGQQSTGDLDALYSWLVPLNDLQGDLLLSIPLFLLSISVLSVCITSSQIATDICTCSTQHNLVSGSSGTFRHYHPVNK